MCIQCSQPVTYTEAIFLNGDQLKIIHDEVRYVG